MISPNEESVNQLLDASGTIVDLECENWLRLVICVRQSASTLKPNLTGIFACGMVVSQDRAECREG